MDQSTLVDLYNEQVEFEEKLNALTNRQKAILYGVSRLGQQNKQMASMMKVSVRTVEGDRHRITEVFDLPLNAVIYRFGRYHLIKQLNLSPPEPLCPTEAEEAATTPSSSA